MYGGGYAGDPRGRAEAVSDRQGRDDFSFEDKKADAQIGGYYTHERDLGRVWNPGPSTKKVSPEESFSAKPIAKPDAKPTPTKIEFYLDETPAFVEQRVTSVAPVAKVTNEPTGEIKHQIDTFSDFVPTRSGALTQAVTGMTPEGWNLHKKASTSIQNDQTLTAAQMDRKKAENIVRLGKMHPAVAATMAYPYQVLQEIFRAPLSNPAGVTGGVGGLLARALRIGGTSGWSNLEGIGSALAEDGSLTLGLQSAPLFNLGGNIANTQMGLMRMYDLLFGQENSASSGGDL